MASTLRIVFGVAVIALLGTTMQAALWTDANSYWHTASNWDISDVPYKAGETATISNGSTVDYRLRVRGTMTLVGAHPQGSTILTVDDTTGYEVGDYNPEWVDDWTQDGYEVSTNSEEYAKGIVNPSYIERPRILMWGVSYSW